MFCWNFEWTRDALNHGRYRSGIEKQMINNIKIELRKKEEEIISSKCINETLIAALINMENSR